jgi:hypothetical protein
MTILFSLLGLGGVGGIVAAWFMVPAFPLIVNRILAAIPPKVLYALLGLIALTFAVIWHGHVVKQVKAAAFAEGKTHTDGEWKTAYETEKAAFDKIMQVAKDRREKISTLERQRHDEAIRYNAALADDLRLRGPGRASAPQCRSNLATGLPAAAGGPGQPAPDPNAPGPEMPADGGQAIVPWGWQVQRAQEHDDLLAEVTSWRRWYPQQAAEFDRLKREIPSPEFGHPTPTH